LKELNEKIVSLRKVYSSAVLNEHEVHQSPFVQFETWMQQAIDAEILEPHAMQLSTVSASGAPSSRVVLLRGFSPEGLVFYTNFTSQKGQDIAANPMVSLLFFWPQLERQIRISGTAAKIEELVAAQYFASRPRESQLGAWASQQSTPVNSRETLETAYATIEKRFEGMEVPKPDFWGGYRIVPHVFEFWQGRPSRMHDRLQYVHTSHEWVISRLSP
jgi:pyridoxamine 5'-phosphate oxidase